MVFYDDFLISREVTKITSIYYLCQVKNRTAMKRNIFFSLATALVASAFITSCGPMEPSTYNEYFYRVATVKCTEDGDASLLIDYTGEKFIFSNFSTKADTRRFAVQDGDRVIAKLGVEAIGNIYNNKLTVEEITLRYPTLSVADARPADSLNYGYRFSQLSLGTVIYPMAWSQGHILNIAPDYYTSDRSKKASFLLYPAKVNGDTLLMDLYSDIPDTVTSLTYTQALLCYDISTLRKSVSDYAEQCHRDSILDQLEKLGKDSILVKISAPQYMRKRIWNVSGEVDEIKFVNIPKPSYTVSVPFDF